MLGAAGTAGRWPGGDRSFAARVPGAAWRGRALAACCLETKMRQPDTAAQPAQSCCWLPGLADGGWRRRGSTTLAEEWGQQTCWAAPPPPAKSRMESFPAHLPIQRSQAALTWTDKYLF